MLRQILSGLSSKSLGIESTRSSARAGSGYSCDLGHITPRMGLRSGGTVQVRARRGGGVCANFVYRVSRYSPAGVEVSSTLFAAASSHARPHEIGHRGRAAAKDQKTTEAYQSPSITDATTLCRERTTERIAPISLLSKGLSLLVALPSAAPSPPPHIFPIAKPFSSCRSLCWA